MKVRRIVILLVGLMGAAPRLHAGTQEIGFEAGQSLDPRKVLAQAKAEAQLVPSPTPVSYAMVSDEYLCLAVNDNEYHRFSSFAWSDEDSAANQAISRCRSDAGDRGLDDGCRVVACVPESSRYRCMTTNAREGSRYQGYDWSDLENAAKSALDQCVDDAKNRDADYSCSLVSCVSAH